MVNFHSSGIKSLIECGYFISILNLPKQTHGTVLLGETPKNVITCSKQK